MLIFTCGLCGYKQKSVKKQFNCIRQKAGLRAKRLSGAIQMVTKLKDINSECTDDILCGVNKVTDSEKPDEFERAHLPVIHAPDRVGRNEPFEVIVKVGAENPHPNESEHFIQFIELYAGETFLSRMDFVPNIAVPVMKTTLSLDHSHGDLRAFIRCNQYGTWLAQKAIQVTD
jgi:superoxide reductase